MTKIILREFNAGLEEQNKELYNCLKVIKAENIQNLVIGCMNDADDSNKVEDAVKVTDWLIFLLKNDNILGEGVNSYFIDLLIASSLLHNLTYEYNVSDWTEMFKTREVVKRINEELELNIPENYLKSIFIPIESQLGKDMPNDQLIPNANTPGAHVALACAIHYKKMK